MQKLTILKHLLLLWSKFNSTSSWIRRKWLLPDVWFRILTRRRWCSKSFSRCRTWQSGRRWSTNLNTKMPLQFLNSQKGFQVVFCRYRRQWQFEKMWIGKSHKTLLAYICLLFCKLDLSIAVQQILCTLIKRSSFQKSVVSKFTPKLTLSLPTVL